MVEAKYQVGEEFAIQYVWQLSDGDFLRAVFTAVVVGKDKPAARYIIKLRAFTAGRQEDPTGEMRPRAEFATDYWARVGALVGCQVAVGYEVDDGRAVRVQLATLTGEHRYFHRLAANAD